APDQVARPARDKRDEDGRRAPPQDEKPCLKTKNGGSDASPARPPPVRPPVGGRLAPAAALTGRPSAPAAASRTSWAAGSDSCRRAARRSACAGRRRS